METTKTIQIIEKLIDEISQFNREWFLYNSGKIKEKPISKQEFVSKLLTKYLIKKL